MTELTVFTYDQIAEQLVDGFWEFEGGLSRHFNVQQGGSVTVNLGALSTAGAGLARGALQLWSDIIGVAFTEVITGGQITFTEDEEDAFSSSVTVGNLITSSHVNVSAAWLANYGTEVNSYSFQVYLHEVGHALGLGHAGNYNFDASYASDALFLNDAWSTSIMSYFSPAENSYFAGLRFTDAFAVTPMSADVVAMAQLYGLSTTTRSGNTVYGFNSNAGRTSYDATQTGNTPVAYAIFDSGGTDTLDYSGYTNRMVINLNPGAFSDVGGGIGNVTIAPGTIIENAIGGEDWDTIIGTPGNNLLNGGLGEDTVSYAAATGGVTIDLGRTTAQDTGAAGHDTLIAMERLIGSEFADRLTGSATTLLIRGGAGDDVITSRSGANGFEMEGEDGDDRFAPGAGEDWIIGGSGFDTVDYGGASAGVDSSWDVIFSVEQLIGSAFDDVLRISFGAIVGAAGNDRLEAEEGAVTMAGGEGDDIYLILGGGRPTGGATLGSTRPADATIIEGSSQGRDLVRSEISYRLPDHVESLTLIAYGALSPDIDGHGNALANSITGNVGANRLSGLDGDDRLFGGGGNDTLDGGAGLDRMYGGVGNDIYTVRDATDYVYENAGEGIDRVISSVSHILRANVEQLSLTGTANLYGRGNADANVIAGNSGANRLDGYDGNDRLYGGAGNDVLDGGTGDDGLRGDAGNDVYYVDSSRDVVVEGLNGGTDTVCSSATLTLHANVERLTLTGTGDIKGTGNDLANIVNGNGGANTLSGMAGNDRLYGHDGADVLIGGGGNDQLDGGAARDRLTGGTGGDLFVFDDGDFGGTTAASADQIIDFNKAERDRIDLRGVDASDGVSGDQAFAFLGTGAFTGTAGELRYQQISGGTFVQADTDGDGAADFWIRIDGLHTLTAGDFVL